MENAMTATRLDRLVGPGFRVQRSMCETCIFRPDSPLDLERLLEDISDSHGGFAGHRVCHHSLNACCSGFWSRHKNDFAMGQIAQRLRMVEFVSDDVFA